MIPEELSSSSFQPFTAGPFKKLNLLSHLSLSYLYLYLYLHPHAHTWGTPKALAGPESGELGS